MHTSCHGLKLLNLHAQEGGGDYRRIPKHPPPQTSTLCMLLKIGLDPLVNKSIPWIPSWKFLEDHNIPGYCNLYNLLSTNILSIS